MATRFCTRCGAVLRDGVCPQGHPQRAARGRPPRRRRRVRGPVTFLVLLAILGAGAYAALVWYPERAAADLMRETAPEWKRALRAYRQAVETLPDEGGKVEEVLAASEEILATSDDARLTLIDAQTRLDAREPTSIPLVSGRPPLGDALQVREDMLAFYVGALEAIVSLENVAGYLSDVSATFGEIENLERAIGDPRGQEGVAEAVESGQPIAEQLVADLESIEAPDEVGSVHATLLAIARRILADLEEAGRSGGAASGIIGALLGDVGEEAGTFRATFAQAPQSARTSGLGRRLTQLRALAEPINAALAELDEAGVPGIVVPRG